MPNNIPEEDARSSILDLLKWIDEESVTARNISENKFYNNDIRSFQYGKLQILADIKTRLFGMVYGYPPYKKEDADFEIIPPKEIE